MKLQKYITLLVLIITLTFSCSTKETEDPLTEEKLVNYLKNRNSSYNFQEHDSNLHQRQSNIEPIYFDSIEEMDEFLNAFDNIKGEHNSNMQYFAYPPPDDDGGGSESYYKETRYIGGLGVFMNIGFTVHNCTGGNLNSWLSGFTLGASYNHVGGSLNTNNNKINYTAHGVLNYNIIVEGIGTVFSQNVSYSGQYICD